MNAWEEKALEREEGREEGREQIGKLIQALLQDDRVDDLAKVAESTEYMEKLLREYNL